MPHRTTSWRRMLVLRLLLSATMAACGAPVAQDIAFYAAQTALPVFFPGYWLPAGELELQAIDGTRIVYVFIFERGDGGYAPSAHAPATPAAYVAATRHTLAAAGRVVSGHEDELYGVHRFATIYISADDTQPPVLRCFEGLPPPLVRAESALSLAALKTPRDGWRVRRHLMTGLFDETYELEHPDMPGEPLLVELRSRTVWPVTEAVRKAASVTPSAGGDLERLSQAAWEPYRAGGRP